jgi:hypothetical protein
MRLLKVVLVSVLLTLPALAQAQATTGTIRGTVVDAQDRPIPGVSVTVAGPQGAKTVVTDGDGKFSVPFLTPGSYTTRAQLSGFKTVEQKDLGLTLGQTLDLPLKMEVGGVTETVSVTATAPGIDTSTTTVGAIIDSDFVQTVPVGRRISDVTYMAPGVSSSNTAGRSNPSIAGGSGLDNQYVIDGVNVTNSGYGALGSYSIIFGSLGNATPFDFVKEVQVKTGGYEAEYGQASGGVVNVVTKSGTNDIRGSVFGYSRPSGLEGGWTQFQSVNGTVQTLGSSLSDAGAEGGAPIIHDRLFAFGAVDGQWQMTTLQAPDGFPLRSMNGVDQNRRNSTYAVKGTYKINSNHRIDASFFGDPSHGDMGPQRVSSLRNSTTSAFSQIDYGGHNQTVRYDGVLSGSWLVEATYARALNSINELPSVNQWQVQDRTVTPNVFTGGIGFYEAGNRGVNNQWSATATNVVKEHQLKYGLEYDDVNYSQVNQRTGPTFVTPVGDTTATGATIQILSDPNFGKIYRVTRAYLNSGRVTQQKYLDFFVQDNWRVSGRLTINPGVRYEQEKMVGTIVDCSTPDNCFQLKNNWAPRIGVTFDPLADHRTKIFGSYGRFYARVPNDLAARALSADAGIGADYFDANLTRPIPNGVLAGPVGSQTAVHYSIAGAGADSIDPNAKMSYTDEYSFGIEREIMPHTSLGVRYVYRNVGRVLEDVANAPMVAYDLALPGVNSVDYILTNPSKSTPILASAQAALAALGYQVSFDDPIHKYQAVEVTLNRRLSNNWSVMTSYRWSRLRGNFEGFYRDDNGQSDPGITSLYDFPTNDPSYVGIGVPRFGYSGDIRYLGQEGVLPLDRPSQFKAFGTYSLAMGLDLGLGLNMSSGKPLAPLAANPNANYQNGGEIPTAPRGSGIQTVDGFRTRTPFLSTVDLQASYKLKFGAGRSVVLLADVFNLFNEGKAIDYDTWTETTFGVPNPDFGKPISQVVSGPQFQTPIQIRFGARFGF